MAEVNYIKPQEGYQMKFLSSKADIAIGGGAAGVGKTFSLLLEPLRHKDIKGFGTVCFRRTSPQIKAEGALWDTSLGIYTKVKGAKPKESVLEWDFGSSKLKFSHLEHEKNKFDWQGSQIPLLQFDELTHFTKGMFFYLLTRNRSVCGVEPYVRATCNPDPDSWVAEFISWWIDEETGFPIPERDGVLRYMVRDGETYIWGHSKDEVIKKAWYLLEPQVKASGIDAEHFVKSVTFISGSIYDNKELLKEDPSYLGNLMAQDKETKSALLEGNWKVVVTDDDIFNYYKLKGAFDNFYEVKTGERYITADIAMKGSDKFVVMVWDGMELIDISIMNKSNGKEVVDTITNFAKAYKIENSNITFDNDGVGSFIDGFIEDSVEFKNGSKAMNDEMYEHLKAQCYYKMGDDVNEGKVRISEHVANKMYDDKMTVRQRIMYERKAIKRAKKDMDGKLKLLPKDQMKVLLNGQSPDLMDAFMMRKVFDMTFKFELYVR